MANNSSGNSPSASGDNEQNNVANRQQQAVNTQQKPLLGVCRQWQMQFRKLQLLLICKRNRLQTGYSDL